ncbi:MAG: hypothetical protein AAFU85_10255 [Planctomycetota bacterium]
MEKTRQRISRIRRLRAIDDIRLDQLAVELGSIQQRMNKWSDQLSEVHLEIDDSFRQMSPGVVNRNQSRVWTDHLQQISLHLAASIRRAATEREQVHERMIEQRAKVRGWDLLLDQLQGEMRTASAHQEHLEADDRFLSKQTVM